MTDATDARNSELLARALELSIRDVVLCKLIKHVDEEITTAALLGFFASNIAWTSALLADSEISPLSWVHYSKHKKDKTSEAYTGADFAIVLRLSKSRWRAAIFQAKRSESEHLSFKHLHISPARDGRPPEPQIIRLKDHSLSMVAQKPLPNGQLEWSTKDLSFAHYLIYHHDDAYLSPLSDHTEEIKKIDLTNTQIKSKGKTDLDDVKALWDKVSGKKVLYPKTIPIRNFSDLLRSGVTEPQMAQGWLEINRWTEASSFIKQTRLLMDVFEGAPLSELNPTVINSNNLTVMRQQRLGVLPLAQPRVPQKPVLQTKSTNSYSIRKGKVK
ncbi:hypothetical protein IAE57_05460 [Stenotrophomonas sp. S48]|uniref:hypothetical protein n=1 Tax=unclassified Stenotrophomonas TaxID=196198 RepID=UPI0018FF3DA7|nr:MULTISPECIES: hypothetical protein [unclassified Stenotrophomonas]MBK0025597.1 hypothetical protein [Stenotrophomonas sp. S48]MBK0047549.1 hypothetical protein [Stenotrophomonas sp. S49]